MKHKIDPKIFSYIAIAFPIIGGILAFLNPNGDIFMMTIPLIFCIICGILCFVLFNVGSRIFSLFTDILNLKQTFENYEIGKKQDVLIKKTNNLYYATAYIGIKVFEINVQKTLQGDDFYNEFFERTITSLKFPLKFNVLFFVRDVSKHRDDLQAKKAEAQLRLSREREKAEPDVLLLSRYEKDLERFEDELNSLTKGIKPLTSVFYASATGIGVSVEGATKDAKANAAELKAAIVNSLNVEVMDLYAEDILKCHTYEFLLPTSLKELEYSTM